MGAFLAQEILTGHFRGRGQNAQSYIHILRNYLLPFAEEQLRVNWMFQQDGASVHTEKVVKKWFHDDGILVIERLAKSPDSNPIENPWDIFARSVHANQRHFNGVQDLVEVIKGEWSRNFQKTRKFECFYAEEV